MTYLTFKPEDVKLVYLDEDGSELVQPVSELVQNGTYSNDDGSEDLPIIAVIVTQ